MFGRFMNNYYYGKSGKGDFRKDDLPHNRKELFLDTLKTRLSGLCRINLLYMLIFLPLMVLLMVNMTQILSAAYTMALVGDSDDYAAYVETMAQAEQETSLTEEQFMQLKDPDFRFLDLIDGVLLHCPGNVAVNHGRLLRGCYCSGKNCAALY